MKISVIMARSSNWVIGKAGDIPWYIPEDFAHFKTTTTGYPLIMGRKTLESFKGRRLPNREHIVVSSCGMLPDSICVSSIEDAIDYCKSKGYEQAFLIGGAKIIKDGYKYADELIITEIDKEFEGDVYMPKFDEDEFKLNIKESFISDVQNLSYSICYYKKS